MILPLPSDRLSPARRASLTNRVSGCEKGSVFINGNCSLNCVVKIVRFKIVLSYETEDLLARLSFIHVSTPGTTHRLTDPRLYI